MADDSQTLNKEEDRISSLPNEIVLHILTFLPINDAVCTSLVSKRWTSLWKSLLSLVFRYYGVPSAKFISHVEKTLAYYDNDDNLQSLCLAFNLHRNDDLYDKVENIPYILPETGYYPRIRNECDIDSWIHTAIKLNVKKIELLFDHEKYNYFTQHYVTGVEYDLPRSLYRHPMLTRLRLRFCGFRKCPKEVQWKSLKSLSIDNADISDELLRKLLGTCAKLESLSLTDCKGMKRIDIVCSNLKELSLGNCQSYGRSGDKVQISAPNLELLVISGPLYYKEFVVGDLSSLVEARILLTSSFSQEEHVSSHVILMKIQHAKKLTLGTRCLQDLFAKTLPGLHSGCKSLTLNVDLNYMDFTRLPNIFEICPKMETLIVYLTKKTSNNRFDDDAQNYEGKCFWMQAKTDYNSLSRHLKMVKINGVVPGSNGAKHVIGLVQFMLKHGRVLEKVSIHTQWQRESSPDVDSFSKLSQTLLSYPKSPPSAVVELTRDRLRKLDDYSSSEGSSEEDDSDDYSDDCVLLENSMGGRAILS